MDKPKLKSYKVYSKDGQQVMSFIVSASSDVSLKDWNLLFQKGMRVVVVDERSRLVNKDYVDKE